MAIYHMTTKIIGRKTGKSAVAGAAYRSGSVIKAAAYRSGSAMKRDEDDEIYDFSRKQDVMHSEIFTPDDAPEWCKDRATLWNTVEAGEKRKDAQFAREVECSLPRELSFNEQKELVKKFVVANFTSKGMIADVCFHNHTAKDGKEHPHVHILLTLRKLDGDQFAAKKERSWNSKSLLNDWRNSWAHHANTALEHAGSDERIDHRTNEEQGKDKDITAQQGLPAHHMQQRGIDVRNTSDIARERYNQTKRIESRIAYQKTLARQQQAKRAPFNMQTPVIPRYKRGLPARRHGAPVTIEAMIWHIMGQGMQYGVDVAFKGASEEIRDTMKRTIAKTMHITPEPPQLAQEYEPHQHFDHEQDMDI